MWPIQTWWDIQAIYITILKAMLCISPFALLTSVWLPYPPSVEWSYWWGNRVQRLRSPGYTGNQGADWDHISSNRSRNPTYVVHPEFCKGHPVPKQVSDERKHKLVCPFEENTHREACPHTCKDLTSNFSSLHCLLSLDFHSSLFKTIGTRFKWPQDQLLNILNDIFY